MHIYQISHSGHPLEPINKYKPEKFRKAACELSSQKLILIYLHLFSGGKIIFQKKVLE